MHYTRLFSVLLVTFSLLLLSVPASLSAPLAETPVPPEPFPLSDRYPAEVTLTSRAMLSRLVNSGVDVANVRTLAAGHLFPAPDDPFEPLIATVYVNSEEAQRLADLGLVVRPIPNPSPEACSGWPTYNTYVTRMQAIATAHPDIVRMTSIGQSVQGRALWVLEITDNPDVEEDEPEFRYVSTMHGNEGVGTEMTIRLAELLADNYGIDPYTTMLVDEMEIWLWPIFNPDGYEACTYRNAHNVNLNRDFPDRFNDPLDDPTGREPETQAAMNWVYGHRFVMGANYHSGARVVNIPWDATAASNPPANPPVYAPDDAIFYEYGVGYAQRNPMIWNGGFPNGITRGWEWYQIWGGMQDWAYHYHGEQHVTIELSDSQPPPYSQMDTYWEANRAAMLWWMERVLTGARGLVTDANTGAPLDATVDVVQIGKPVRTDPDVGDYHRLLLPGTYTLVASATCYEPQSAQVTVISGTATVQDFALVPHWVAAAGSERVGAPGETVTHTIVVTNTCGPAASYDLSLIAGDWPATLLDVQIGPLEPLQSGQARVVVHIPAQPATATLLASDVFTVAVTSVANPQASAQARGTTHAVADLSLALSAEPESQAGTNGETVTYTLFVANTGDYTDTYTLSVSGNAWAAVVSPAQAPPLGPGAVATAWVQVTIPPGPLGETDGAIVRAVSGWNAQIYAERALTTSRAGWSLFLPVLARMTP